MTEVKNGGLMLTPEIVEAEVAEKGWLHFRADIDPRDTLAIGGLFTMLQKQLGDSDRLPDTSIVAQRDNSTFFSEGNGSLSLHTDTHTLETPCGHVALFCALQAQEGGENKLVDGLAVAQTLPCSMQAELSKPQWHWINPCSPEVSSPDLRVIEEEGSMRWWREGLHHEVGLAAVVNTFDIALNESAQAVLLQPGEGLILDNSRVLHGRGEFSGPRQMWRARIW